MQKKEIKKRRTTTHTKTTNDSKTKKIKKRVSLKKANNIKIVYSVIFAAIILLCYFTLDLLFTVITILGIALIVFISEILKKSDKKKKKILRILLTIVLTIGILGLSCFVAFLIYIKVEADPMFVTAKLDTPENTTLLDINGKEFGKLGTEMREKITYDELPEVLVDAIVATEDSRFFQHNGFDAPRFLKAVLGQLAGKSDAGGASTLSMQVVKNSLTDATEVSGITGIIRKFKDIYLAIFKLEKNYTKEQIIEYYVNNHYLGGNIYGVQEASEVYFGKSVSELNLSEAAILAGMFKSPIYYRPTDHAENATKRRDTVLYLMQRHGYITKEERQLASSIPVESLVVENNVTSGNEYQGYIDTVVAEVKEKYDVNPYTTPLTIYTNLDTAKQNAVNSVFSGEAYSWINDKVQAGVAVLDSETGKILAIGNGRNINGRTAGGLNQLNYATDIQRQPGSTAKPLFDYGPGIEYNNWSTYTLFDDEPYSYSNGRSIKNWDGGYYGTITLRRALATSRNIPALKAFQQVDNKKIIEFVTNLGLSPEIENGKIHEAHSIGAFSPGTNPLEMSAAYAAFSNKGYYNEPYSVSKIVFKSTGETKEHNEDNYVINRKAMSEATAFMISSVLQDVALTGGTPKNLACKTGTTNYDDATMEKNNLPGDAVRDSWVVGYSTKTVIGMWYGYDFIDSEYCLRNIPATIQKDKLFNALVKAGAMESNREAFKQPESVVKVGVVMGTNPPKLAGSYTGSNVIYEYFKKDYAPEEKYVEEKLQKPANFKVKYNKLTKKVTMSWNAVDEPDLKDSPGTFGYNIYLGTTHIGFTEKTSFTYSPKETPFGTYKVIAGYKGYSGIESEAATYTLKEDEEETIDLKLIYTGTTVLPDKGTLGLDLSNFEVTNNSTPIEATIESCTPNQILLAGNKTIVCKVKYKDQEYTLSTTITFTNENSATE